MAAAAGAAALWGGLARTGWAPGGAGAAAHHGALAVLGALGTLIAVERAAALGRPWAFGAPLLSGIGALLLLAAPAAGGALLLAGAVVLVAVVVAIVRLQPALHHAVLLGGALLWAVSAALLVAGLAPYRVAPWGAGFLVTTIAGERLELSRLAGGARRARGAFLGALSLLVGGLVVSAARFGPGVRVAGAGLLALAAWLAVHDVARRTVRGTPLARFVASCLLSGYAWLLVGGSLWLAFGGVAAGPRHDAMLHAVLVGFVLSMVFGHAPLILPAVLGGAVAYRPRFYAHLALLHASLLLRVGGDLAGAPAAIRWGGLLGALAVVVFAASTLGARTAASAAASAGDA